MACTESTVRVADIPAIIDDPDRGLISLVGDRDGLSTIIGDIHPSEVHFGVTAVAVETEHGTLYLNPDTEQVISEDDGNDLDDRCFEGALVEVDDAITTLLADSFGWFVGDDRAQIYERRGALAIAVELIGRILDQLLMDYPAIGQYEKRHEMTEVIYVVAKQRRRDSYDGSPLIEEEIDPDYGYFITRNATQAFIDSIDENALAKYQEQSATYQKRLRAWQRKEARAAELGFANPDRRPVPNLEEPLPHLIVEISPRHKESE